MKVFELNAKRYPNVWPVHVGLARGHIALGHTKEALAEARLAVKQAPDESQPQERRGADPADRSGPGNVGPAINRRARNGAG